VLNALAEHTLLTSKALDSFRKRKRGVRGTPLTKERPAKKQARIERSKSMIWIAFGKFSHCRRQLNVTGQTRTSLKARGMLWLYAVPAMTMN